MADRRHVENRKIATCDDEAERVSSLSAVRHLGFLKLEFLTAVHFTGVKISLNHTVHIQRGPKKRGHRLITIIL